MINPNIRLYLPDVINGGYTEEIIEMLTDISNDVRSASKSWIESRQTRNSIWLHKNMNTGSHAWKKDPIAWE